ncbi:DUF3786 domain-containing protein [Desulfotignum phosphitoxidans]|uniref:DUF3786 domain-containing protein n=1 Tax=Desulfotignum phosphitoxidans DSM 13687 TaxID=1286635 RepID=S0FT56_9BACT|nr:DUF3786 domain-containing protein [Desulfotignum phosphitoxidans]EMS77885.1 hypothetical protein, DUF3786 [Desulfotignum phosphitoxidans DSM 13687]
MNHDLVDPLYFTRLAEQDPADVCRRAVCTYDEAAGIYGLTVWGREYAVDPRQGRIFCVNPDPYPEPLHPYFDLFAVHYLLSATEVPPAGQWISEKDIPGGSTFFRGPHAVPTHGIASRFDEDIQGFTRRCEQYGGTRLALADAAFSFFITPRVPVAVLFWQGDEEFPAEAKLLFDKTIARHLASDIVYALAVGVCEQLKHPDIQAMYYNPVPDSDGSFD